MRFAVMPCLSAVFVARFVCNIAGLRRMSFGRVACPVIGAALLLSMNTNVGRLDVSTKHRGCNYDAEESFSNDLKIEKWAPGHVVSFSGGQVMTDSVAEFLKDIETSKHEDKYVTTSLSGEALEIVRRWQNGRGVKVTVARLLGIADAELRKAQGKDTLES